jgi:competence ComEA-like helix-hairpin-helix protein
MKAISGAQKCLRHAKAFSGVMTLIVLATGIAGAAAARRHELITEAAGQAQGKPPIKEMTVKEEEERAAVVEETMDRACRMCHPIENILRMRRTVREWADVLTTMQGRGASATEDEFQGIHWYLSRYYGVVRVNAAGAEELAAVLGLSAKEAEAIVDYRKAHGNIADLPALLKIEGIDKAKAKIEEQPEALRFN